MKAVATLSCEIPGVVKAFISSEIALWATES